MVWCYSLGSSWRYLKVPGCPQAYLCYSTRASSSRGQHRLSLRWRRVATVLVLLSSLRYWALQTCTTRRRMKWKLVAGYACSQMNRLPLSPPLLLFISLGLLSISGILWRRDLLYPLLPCWACFTQSGATNRLQILETKRLVAPSIVRVRFAVHSWRCSFCQSLIRHSTNYSSSEKALVQPFTFLLSGQEYRSLLLTWTTSESQRTGLGSSITFTAVFVSRRFLHGSANTFAAVMDCLDLTCWNISTLARLWTFKHVARSDESSGHPSLSTLTDWLASVAVRPSKRGYSCDHDQSSWWDEGLGRC